ncbi:hypothetical protein FDP41_011258 [Naegleria fowleri]|uniref:Autophagy protein ATG17-like domain-containing protein n=1 Tax=Naegleria fowleri TaxID=5763 RepID=A0A6A5C9E8_NAEFO|nr:uncharacterized protein FDP41_011258 [Naegleria fowleri]KAF0982328.1 hypothetical protein FDP41_011258 [Naegleria fowleri]CAG4714147.1 unnamed protein product [Naegleria fowleri]
MKVFLAEEGTLLLDTIQQAHNLQPTTTPSSATTPIASSESSLTSNSNISNHHQQTPLSSSPSLSSLHTIHQLKQFLEKVAGIALENQILLDSKGAKVDNEQHVSDIEDEEEQIYLFDRMSFSSKTKSQSLLKIISDEYALLESREVTVFNLPDDVQKKIKNNELYRYVQQFYTQLTLAENIVKSSENRVRYCITKLEQMRAQNDSIGVALLNLDGHTKSSSASLKKFKERFDKIESKYVDLLQTLDEDIEKLGTIELHPSLQTQNKKSLQDCIPIQQIKLWGNKCLQELNSFKEKVIFTLSVSQQIDRDVDTQLLLVVPPVNFSMLSKLCTESENIVNTQRELVNNINRNFQSLLQMASKSDNQNKDVTVIVQLVDTHQNYLNQLREHENTLKSTCEKIAQSKIILTKYQLEKLKVISTIQYNILKLNKKMQTFVSILKNIMTKFHHVSIPKYLPGAYYMSLLEIMRRKAYIRKFDSEVVKASEILSDLREEEIRNRKNFFRAFGKFLPPQLFDKINELPASVDEIWSLLSAHSLNETSKLPNISAFDESMENVIKMDEIEKTFNDAMYFGDTGSNKLDFRLYSKYLDQNNLMPTNTGFNIMSDKSAMVASSLTTLDLERLSMTESDNLEHHQGSSSSSSPRSFKLRANLDEFEAMEKQLSSALNKMQQTPRIHHVQTDSPSDLEQLREENQLLKQQILQLQKENELLKSNMKQ